MKELRTLHHIVHADLLERIRQYSFLISLGLALILGYSIASGQLVLVLGQDFRGVINSAWVGAVMAVMINFFLGLFGFYLVKGSIYRDYQTGVGQIMATTPFKRPLYTLGKWMSNFTVLGAMVALLILIAVIMQLFYREDPTIQWWPLLSPFILLVLPFMAFTSALAVFFDTIPWLRGGLGNVVYFFFFTTVVVMLSVPAVLGTDTSTDLMGYSILAQSLGKAAKAVYPEYAGGFEITWFITDLQTFHWNGIAWSRNIVISRIVLLFFSAGIAVLSAFFFDRFNPSRLLLTKKKRTTSNSAELPPVVERTAPSDSPLTPLSCVRKRYCFSCLFIAELKLFLKGQQWWWYTIAVGLVIAQLFMPLDIARNLLVVAWIWHILLLSKLGCREKVFDTCQMVFSAPHPVAAQLPAMLLSAWVVTALMGSGVLLRFISAGDSSSVLGWLTGVLFIPSFALACGILTSSNKAFEMLYVLWVYMKVQKIPMFDFMGMTPESPIYIYAFLSLIFLVLSFFVRQQQVKENGT